MPRFRAATCPACGDTGLVNGWERSNGRYEVRASNDPDAPDDPDWDEYCDCPIGHELEAENERGAQT